MGSWERNEISVIFLLQRRTKRKQLLKLKGEIDLSVARHMICIFNIYIHLSFYGTSSVLLYFYD